MSCKVLVACVGNIFFGDDGFGVVLARHLVRIPWPDGVVVTDFGIRGVHLAYELLDPPQALVLVDAVYREGPPGTLYAIEPDLAPARSPAPSEPHGMDLPSVFAMVRAMGGELPPVVLVGVEPASVYAGGSLSATVRAAIPEAVRLVRETVASQLQRTARSATIISQPGKELPS